MGGQGVEFLGSLVSSEDGACSDCITGAVFGERDGGARGEQIVGIRSRGGVVPCCGATGDAAGGGNNPGGDIPAGDAAGDRAGVGRDSEGAI